MKTVLLTVVVLLCLWDVNSLTTKLNDVQGCRPTADVIFLLDGSDSQSDDEFTQQREFIKRFVRLSDVSQDSIRVGYAVVSSTIGDEFYLNNSFTRDSVLTAVDGITQPQEGSRTDLGLVEIEQMFELSRRPGVLRIGVILTDGRAMYTHAAEGEAKVVKNNGVFLIAIGVGRLIKFAELEKIASTRSNAYHLVPLELSSKLLSETVKFLGRESCSGHNLLKQRTTSTQTSTNKQVVLGVEPASESVTQPLPSKQPRETNLLPSLPPKQPQPHPTSGRVFIHSVNTGVKPEQPSNVQTTRSTTQAPITSTAPLTTTTPTTTPSTTIYLTTTQPLTTTKATTTTAAKSTTKPTPLPVKQSPSVQAKTAKAVAVEIPPAKTAKAVAVEIPPTKMISVTDSSGIAVNLRGGLTRNNVVTVHVGTGLSPTHRKPNVKYDPSPSPQQKLEPEKPGFFIHHMFDMDGMVPFKMVERRIELMPLITTTIKTIPPTTPPPPKMIPGLQDEVVEQLCSNARVRDGIGYSHHPHSCTEFIQCYHSNGVRHVELARCPFEMLYDDKQVACVYHGKTSCVRDPCKTNKHVLSYHAQDNCRGYWGCDTGESVPKCCPQGSAYKPGRGCIRNINCTVTCMEFGDIQVVTKASKCKLLSMSTNPSFFFENIAGMGWLPRKCVKGSKFDHSLCGCEGAEQVTENACKPEFHMDFQQGIRDSSGNGISLGNTNVKTELGAGLFNGRSLLKLWRFSGVSLGQKLTVSFRFRTSVMARRGKLMHVVSNCCYGCQTVPHPSIDIAIVPVTDGGIAVFGATTDTAGEIFVYVPYKDTFTGWNTLTYTYDGLTLQGKVNYETAHKNLIGDIQARPEPLSIGACGTKAAFQGYIDDFKFYMCNP